MDRGATISPSQINRLMAKRGLGKGAETYADELITRHIGVEEDDYISYDMQWGIIHEWGAIQLYQEKYLVKVQEKERRRHPEYRFITGEADGIIGDRGGIEVKCPKSKYHLQNLRDGAQIDQYYDQMQAYMWIYGLSWMDFVSYDPRFPEEQQLAVHRVTRDEERIELMEERSLEFWSMYRKRLRRTLNYDKKLTLEEAEDIRKSYKETDYTMRSFALEFDVSVSTISAIVNNKIYLP